jgi:hypothetical protein
MIPEKQLTEFVDRLKSAVGPNLLCALLHGSAASEDFHADFSDVNILCVVHELSLAAMQSLLPALQWWTDLKHSVPLFFTPEELKTAADVFAIEMLDIQQRHRVLYGDDIFTDLHIPMARHRMQLEHELRTKLLFLRQHYLVSSGDDGKVRHLMLDSVSSFIVLFRHTLITLGEKPPHTKNEIVERLAARIQFDPAPFQKLLQVRERKLKAEALEVQAVFAAYLSGIEKVVRAVDALV